MESFKIRNALEVCDHPKYLNQRLLGKHVKDMDQTRLSFFLKAQSKLKQFSLKVQTHTWHMLGKLPTFNGEWLVWIVNCIKPYKYLPFRILALLGLVGSSGCKKQGRFGCVQPLFCYTQT